MKRLTVGDYTMMASVGFLVILLASLHLGKANDSSEITEYAVEDPANEGAEPGAVLATKYSEALDESNRSAALPAQVNNTLLPVERENWSADENSYGWGVEDREFLREHGVSEAEARVAETILRQQGIY